MLDAFGREPVAEISIEVDEMIVGAASNPKQVDLLLGLGVQRWEVFVELR